MATLFYVPRAYFHLDDFFFNEVEIYVVQFHAGAKSPASKTVIFFLLQKCFDFLGLFHKAAEAFDQRVELIRYTFYTHLYSSLVSQCSIVSIILNIIYSKHNN